MAGFRTVSARWRMIVESLTRPYRVSLPMVALVALIPCYIYVAALIAGRPLHAPALLFDRSIPLRPTWALLYGPFYLFLIILPVFVVRQDDHLRRTVWAYLLVWGTALEAFMVYPTVAPRPTIVLGDGFAVWGLRFLYAADPPYNCFPSLHVAHSFVSALTLYRSHRLVGVAAVLCASLVGISTLYTKQHYILDVAAGVLLASLAYALLLHHVPRDAIAQRDRDLVPSFALLTIGLVGIGLACFWLVYQVGPRPTLAHRGRSHVSGTISRRRDGERGSVGAWQPGVLAPPGSGGDTDSGRDPSGGSSLPGGLSPAHH